MIRSFLPVCRPVTLNLMALGWERVHRQIQSGGGQVAHGGTLVTQIPRVSVAAGVEVAAALQVIRVRNCVVGVRNLGIRVRSLVIGVRNSVIRVRNLVIGVRNCAIGVRNSIIRVRNSVIRVQNSVIRVRRPVIGSSTLTVGPRNRAARPLPALFRRILGLLPPARLPEALAQLLGHRLEARCRLGGGLDIVIDLGRFPHRLAAHRHAGIVDLRGYRGGQGAQLGQLGTDPRPS